MHCIIVIIMIITCADGELTTPSTIATLQSVVSNLGTSDGRKNIDIFTYFVACFILHQLLGSMCFVQYQCEMFLIIPQVLPSHLTLFVAYQCVARVTMEASHPIISMSFTLGKNILRRRKFSSVDISSLLITIGSALCQVWWLTGGA